MRGSIIPRLTACLLALCLLGGGGVAEGPGADWFAPVLHVPGSEMHRLTEAQLAALSALPSKEIHALAEAMFCALAGTDESSELRLWKSFKTADQKEARRTELADYRARTRPFLLAVFQAGNRAAYLTADAQPTPAPVPTATPAALPAAASSTPAAEAALPAYTLADSWEAFGGNEQGNAFQAMLAPLGGTDAQTGLAAAQAVMQRWLAEIGHDDLKQTNGDYQLWLYGAGTPLDYPVVQCDSNSYYLNRLFNRKKNPAGTLFIDSRNLPDFADPNTLIYGHHMRDSSMFHCLTDYDAPGFYEAHPWMVAVFADRICLIEVLAGYVTDAEDHCYTIALSDADEMRKFVDAAVEKSYFVSHVAVDCSSDRLVTLSTCAYNFDNARCVLIGRLTRLWQRK